MPRRSSDSPQYFPSLTDSRTRPQIPTAAVFAGGFTLFATRRGSLNGLEQDLRFPARLRGLVGAEPPSVDSIGRIYALMDSQPLRRLLRDIVHRLKRNKALIDCEGYAFAAVDGHELFSSRKRCCPQCQTPHDHGQGGADHRILSPGGGLPVDRPGPGVGPGRRVAPARRGGRDRRPATARAGRSPITRGFFDVVVGDALYFNAPFINFCRDRHKHVIVTAKGEDRLLVQDAAGLFAHQQPGRWVDHVGTVRRGVRYWDEDGFTSCEGVKEPLRVLRTEETVRRRERIAGRWQETEETTTWSWATTLPKESAVDAGAVAVGPWPLGHREQRLQHAVDALGFGSLLQARPGGDRQLPADIVHRVRPAAELLAAEPQAGGSRGPDADRPGAGAGPRRGRLPGAVGRAAWPVPPEAGRDRRPEPADRPLVDGRGGDAGRVRMLPRGVAGWPRESGAGTTTPGRKAVKPARSRLSVGRGSSKAGELRNC